MVELNASQKISKSTPSPTHITDDHHHPRNHNNVSARVSDPKGESLHYSDNLESGEFAFTANLDGTHTVSPPITSILNKDNIHFMELELKKLEESVHTIHNDIMHLRAREEEMLKLNQKSNSIMAMMSLLSLFICLGVGGLQLWHLKAFFERKKIL